MEGEEMKELTTRPKTVLETLTEPMTMKQIADKTGFSKRSVYHAVKVLRENKLVKFKPSLKDARTVICVKVEKV